MSSSSTSDRRVFDIPCNDVGERGREFQVIAVPGRLSFVTPPGNVAHVQPHQYRLLRQVLLDALAVALKEPT